MPLTLTVPAPDPVEDPTVEMRPKTLQERLDALPLNYLPEIARTLKDDIGALNRHKVELETRLQLLELYRGLILKLLPALEAQFVAAHLPLPEHSRQMATLTRELHIALADGYKIILLDFQHKLVTLGKGQVALVAAQRAISALSRILAVCYQTYAPTPAGVWLEIHQIFRFALERGLTNKTVADAQGASTISSVYKQVLLLALADPYHLNPGEVEKILGYLALFGNLAQLQPFMQAGNPVGLFLVQTEGDTPPKNVPQNLDSVDSRNDILLNTLGLAQALRHHAAKLEEGEPPQRLNLPDEAGESSYLNLMGRLLKYWWAVPKRGFQRTQHISSTEVCIGLPAVHHFLGRPASGDNAGAQFISGKWLIVNESAGGLALRGIFKVLPQVRPGNIIGLKGEGSGEWNIGAVRWVKSEKSNHLEIGCQLLAPWAAPVKIAPTSGDPAEIVRDALLLPEIHLLKQPESLIAPRGIFDPERELRLELGDGTSQTIRAVKLAEQSASYERFLFSRG